MDTIYALASARGKAGVAVVRISGQLAAVAAERLLGPLPPARQAGLRRLRAAAGDILDEALVLFFPAGQSFTGEAVTELHLHGSQAVVAAVLAELGRMDGLRLAEPGEFTRRALENGRLDLTQVEGLADLIEAETESQRRQAQRVLSGAIGARAEGWRSGLVRAAALIAATIDFADEDVPTDVAPEVCDLIDGLLAELRAEVAGVGAAERIRDGFEVAIVGRPNAGKSMLLNALAGREAAITSEIAGTTRDVIEVRLDLRGLAVTLLDTAGLRPGEDAIEGIGVRRALERAEAADLRVFLIDDRDLPDEMAPREGDLMVWAKADLGGPPEGYGGCDLAISGLTGAGLGPLVAAIGGRLEGRAAGAASLISARQRQAAERAIGAMESARVEVLNGAGRAELAAEELRRAMHALDMLVGRVDVEDLLDEIFAHFCIGK